LLEFEELNQYQVEELLIEVLRWELMRVFEFHLMRTEMMPPTGIDRHVLGKAMPTIELWAERLLAAGQKQTHQNHDVDQGQTGLIVAG
jgi:hypothetical protein